jgi:hypothetical protein
MIGRVVAMVKGIVAVVLVIHVTLPSPPSQYHVSPQSYPSFPSPFHSCHYCQINSPHSVIVREAHDIE